MATQFETRVAGIPCICDITYIEGTEKGYRRGHPDTWEPDEPGYAEYNILERGGRRAPWLEVKMNDDDRCRMLCEIEKFTGVKL